MGFARGKDSLFVCDNCGFTYPYPERRKTSYGTVVCVYCDDGAFDKKNHPQNFGPPPSEDPQGLEDARPEVPLSVVGPLWTPAMTRVL